MRISPDWRIAELGELLEFIGNGTTAEQNKDGDGLPVTRIETIASDYVDASRVGFIANTSEELLRAYRMAPGDVLFSHINSEPQIGRTVVYLGVPPVLIHGMNLLRLRFKTDIADPQFIAYLFRHYRERGIFVGLASRAVGQSSINQGRLRTLKIQLPPLTKQRAIAETLKIVQKAKEARQREVTMERERKSALMEHLFTHGTRGENVKQTETGKIPASWTVRSLDSVAELYSGGTPSKKRPDWWRGSIPWVSTKDLKHPRLSDVSDHITEEALREGSRLAPAKSLFVGVRGMILAKEIPVCLAEVPMAFNQDVKAIVPHEDVNADFLLYAVNFYKPALNPHVGTSAHGTRRISSEVVAKLEIPVPSADEQAALASVLTACDNQITTLEKEESILGELFNVLLEELMNGQLDVSTPLDGGTTS